MSEIRVRQALLADVHAITDCYCANVPDGVFTRRNPDGTRTAVPYSELGLAERFMNGGPWMSVETCAVWIAHLLRRGDEIPLVVEVDGVVQGEAEVTIGHEPSPYGHHLHISSLSVHAASQRQGYGTALIDYIRNMGTVMDVHQITTPHHNAASAFFSVQGFQPVMARRLVVVPARQGRVFYKAVEVEDFNPARIQDWHMPLGRYQSARHEWNRMLPGFWNGVPALVEPQIDRFEIQITNQPGILLLQEDRHIAGRAEAFLWTERALTPHMVSAVRDRAAQLGYETLTVFVDDTVLPLLEPEAIDIRDPEVLLGLRLD